VQIIRLYVTHLDAYNCIYCLPSSANPVQLVTVFPFVNIYMSTINTARQCEAHPACFECLYCKLS